MRIMTSDKPNNFSHEQQQNMLTDLIEKNSLLYLIFNQSPNAIMITDASAKIVYVNPSWEKLSGYTFEEVKGKDPNILQSAKTPRSVFRQLWTALKNNQSFVTDEIINKKKDGTTYRIYSAFFPV